MNQEVSDLENSHVFWMLFVVKVDVLANVSGVGSFSSEAEVLESGGLMNPIHELGRRRLAGGRHSTISGGVNKSLSGG